MKTYIKKISSTVLIGSLGIAFSFGGSQADEASVAGIYLVVEMNGERLPVSLSVEKPDGERCEKTVLEGALLLDSEGRSSAFITEQVICPSEGRSENAGERKSVMFPGSYIASDNKIVLQDDFGTDEAVIKGDILVYETGGGDRPIEEYILRKVK